ncbi:hypothetical protein ACFO4N_07450 [Camelliibacillus cellulosilyticus]|uniref:Phr family secreted Rap phosphatase inhibitor n=1 Tax=Camelliibacillus cellulosilyticus TaxID=2174486 RepID=A0ABV9GMU0_9BACL
MRLIQSAIVVLVLVFGVVTFHFSGGKPHANEANASVIASHPQDGTVTPFADDDEEGKLRGG